MTVLNEYMSAEIPTYGVIIIGVVALFAIAVISWITMDFDDVILAIIGGVIGAAGITAMLLVARVNVEHHYVQATIEDDYPFAEIYEQYEIVSKDGEIYTLKEKGNK